MYLCIYVLISLSQNSLRSKTPGDGEPKRPATMVVRPSTTRPREEARYYRGVQDHVSSGQYLWEAKRTCILHKDFSRGHNVLPMQNPMSIVNMALPSIILNAAAHVGIESLGKGSLPRPTGTIREQ